MPWPRQVTLTRQTLQFRDERDLCRTLPKDMADLALRSRVQLTVWPVRGPRRTVRAVGFSRGPGNTLLTVVWGSPEFIRPTDIRRAYRRSHTRPPQD